MTTAEELITENIDLWTGAVKRKSSAGRGTSKKIELYGVKKLRALILEMAVRGLLVPQDLNDEPASVLLEKIEAEKAELVKEKKIKKQKALPSINSKEIPYSLPKGWEWIRLGNAGISSTGKTPSTKEPEFFDGEIPFIGPGQITPNGQLLNPEKFLSKSGIENSEEAISGDVLMVCIGGSIGKAAISTKQLAFNQQINSIRPIASLSKFIYIAVTTNTFYSSLLEKATGSATPIINRSRWESLLIPICSEAEQHRIVAKVDELMALCDQLEQQTEANISAHQTLVETLLAAITRSDSSKGTNPAESVELLFANFDSLFTTEDSIDQLKQTILQLAVMGKLVPQDPTDEPSSVLLEKIAAEKEKLVKEKKIKKQKALPPIGDEEKPFELPVGWDFKKLGELAHIFSGNSFKSGDFLESNGTKVIKISNVGVGELIATEDYLPKTFFDQHKQFQVYKGDLVMALTRPYISSGLKVAVCTRSYHNSLLNQRVAVIRTEIDRVFLYKFMQSYFVLGLYQERFSNSGLQPNLKMSDVSDLVIPVPPLKEQRRIVAKVDELMAICDQLKAQLNTVQTTQLHLADAVTEQAIT